MFVRFGRSLGADDWSVWNEDSKQKALKLWNNLMSEAPDFFPVDKEFVRSPCIKDTSWRSWMNPAVGKGILESEVSGEGQWGRATKDEELALQGTVVLVLLSSALFLSVGREVTGVRWREFWRLHSETCTCLTGVGSCDLSFSWDHPLFPTLSWAVASYYCCFCKDGNKESLCLVSSFTEEPNASVTGKLNGRWKS